MSIAQPSVAGEGAVHPFDQEHPDLDVDQKARSQFTCDTTNLPWVIYRAAFRAEHLSELPARARALLAALARTVDAERPYAAIFARRELLTGRALQSMRTFYRGLDDLESAGLILRPPQKRHGEVGLFGRAYLHLTPKAAVLLGLVETEAVEHTAKANLSAPDASTALTDRPSAKVAHGGIYKDLFPTASQKRQPGQLPADLERLRALGFRRFLIFKLMGEARQHGKRLSDVVEVSWAHLQAAHAPIAYLRKLLRVPVDFEFQRRARQVAAHEAQAAARDAEQVHETVTRCAGRTFFDTHAQRRWHVAPDATTLTILNVREASERVAVSGWQSEFVQRWEAGKLLVATPELAAQFEAQRAQAVQERARTRVPVRGRVAEGASAAPAGVPQARQITPTMQENLAQIKSMVAMFAGCGLRGVRA